MIYILINRKSPHEIEVLVGTNDLNTTEGAYYQVERILNHGNYSKKLNDIAVIRVQDKFKFNDRIQAIELSTEGVPDDAEVEFSGWGVKSVRKS